MNIECNPGIAPVSPTLSLTQYRIFVTEHSSGEFTLDAEVLDGNSVGSGSSFSDQADMLNRFQAQALLHPDGFIEGFVEVFPDWDMAQEPESESNGISIWVYEFAATKEQMKGLGFFTETCSICAAALEGDEEGNIVSHIRGRRKAWTAEELSDLLSMSLQHIYKLARNGRMPSYRIGGAVRFDPAATADWLEARCIAA